MIFKINLLFGLIIIAAVSAIDTGSNDLLKQANQLIGKEFLLTDPFWTNTMIPVAVCLAVILLVVSIFAVSLIAIKALNEPEPAFETFAPPGFDAIWERNVQAELGLNSVHKTFLKERDEMIQVRAPVMKFSDYKNSMIKGMQPNIPLEPPKPQLATNSKTGLEILSK